LFIGEESQESKFGFYGKTILGNANSTRPQERQGQRGSAVQRVDANGGKDAERETKPALGRDTDGPTDWLDDAELYTTCDNRTDELRLLGNGVVPATAELAFRTLMKQIGKWEETE
jgi:hypothetical protein